MQKATKKWLFYLHICEYEMFYIYRVEVFGKSVSVADYFAPYFSLYLSVFVLL